MHDSNIIITRNVKEAHTHLLLKVFLSCSTESKIQKNEFQLQVQQSVRDSFYVMSKSLGGNFSVSINNSCVLFGENVIIPIDSY